MIIIIIVKIVQDSDIDEMFAFADANSDGRLSFQEFEVIILIHSFNDNLDDDDISILMECLSVSVSITKKWPCHIQGF